MKSNLLNIKLLSPIINWVIKWWYPNVGSKSIAHVILFIEMINKLIENNGILFTIKRLKDIRLIVTRYISGNKLMVINNLISIDKDGFPKSIRYLKRYADSNDPHKKRFLMTLLMLSRCLEGRGKVSYDTITDPFKGTSTVLDQDIIHKICKDFDIIDSHKTIPFDIVNSHMSGKSGPAGKALGTCLYHVDKYTQHDLGAMGLMVGDAIVLYLQDVQYIIPEIVRNTLSKVKYTENRRLSIVSDPEAKERVIAIIDYWSQFCFKELHNSIFKILRSKFPQDRTFTQDPFLQPPKEGNNYHSLDLTAATDRLPIDLQVQVLAEISRETFSQAWKNLMVKEPFLLPDSSGYVKYSVGQPMGALSSWGMLALTHHIIVQYSAIKVNKYPFNGYILLGDDIVINDDDVAKSYRDLMKFLGVDISEHKTHVSKDTYEFAKRWIHKGIEITGFPLRGFLNNLNNPFMIYSNIFNMIEKGQYPRKAGYTIITLIRDLQKIRKVPINKIRTQCNSLELFSLILRTKVHKTLPVQELRSHLCRIWNQNNQSIDIMIPNSELMLNRYWTATTSLAIGMQIKNMTSKLMNMTDHWVKRYHELLDQQWPLVQKHRYYKVFAQSPHYYSFLNEIFRINRKDRLLMNFSDFFKVLERIVIPNPDTMFSDKRNTIDLIVASGEVSKALYKVLKDNPSAKPGEFNHQHLGSSYVKGMTKFIKLSHKPVSNSELDLQQAMAELMM